MTKAEVQRLLALASGFDSRNPSDAERDAWFLLLEPYDIADAVEALKDYYREHRERVMPSDLIEIMDGWREQWVQRQLPGNKPPGWRPGSEATVSGETLGAEIERYGGWDSWMAAKAQRDREIAAGAVDGSPRSLDGGS